MIFKELWATTNAGIGHYNNFMNIISSGEAEKKAWRVGALNYSFLSLLLIWVCSYTIVNSQLKVMTLLRRPDFLVW